MFLDAYTIRKAVPRILIAVIGINLSIYLCIAAIDVFNLVGNGLGNLITAPFLNNDAWREIGVESNTSNNIVGITFLLSLFAGGAALIFAPAVIGAMALFALPAIAAFIISASLIILAVLFTLVIRQAIIIFCVIISPVAIALFVLPGTEKYFKSWWGLFSKALLVYPIVTVIFAISTVMTTVILGTADLSPGAIGLVKILSAVVVAFAPLVMIPFSFKLAGGALSTIMNAGAGKSRTLSNSARQGIQKSKQDPNSLLGRTTMSNFDKRSARGLTGRGIMARTHLSKGRRDAALSSARQAESLRAAKERSGSFDWEANKDDDKFVKDLASYGTGEESRTAIANGTHSVLTGYRESQFNKIRTQDSRFKDIVGSLSSEQNQLINDEISSSSGYNALQQQMYAISASADRTGRGQGIRAEAASSGAYISYGLSSGEKGWKEFEQDRNSIFGEGDSAEKRAFTNKFQYVAKGSGRFDLSGAVDNGSYNPDRGWDSASLYQLATMVKPSDTEAHVKRTLELLDPKPVDPNKPLDPKEIKEMQKKGAARVLELKQMLPNATGGIRDQIVKKLSDMEAGYDKVISSMTEQDIAEIKSSARVYDRPDPNDPNFRRSWEDRQ